MSLRLLRRSIEAQLYKIMGSRPWKFGYSAYHRRQVEAVLSDAPLMNAFAKGLPLPDGYGYSLDERIVEFPWAITQLAQSSHSRILDAGSTFNFEHIVKRPEFNAKELTIFTLAPESRCFFDRRISYMFGDIRKSPFDNGWFEEIFCLSVLEHVGMNNQMLYTSDTQFSEQAPEDYLRAMQELKRILADHGKLHITVPFGKYENHGFFQQFDASMITRLIDIFAPTSVTSQYYLYSRAGWQVSSSKECAGASYCNVHDSQSAELSKGKKGDRAAAARAVACISLTK